MAVYQWNGSDVTAAINRLNSEINTFRCELSFIQKNKKKVLSVFEGSAARQFQANLDADIINVQTIIEQLGSVITALQKVSGSCFNRCEAEVHRMVTNLRANLV